MPKKEYKIVPSFIDRFNIDFREMQLDEYRDSVLRDIYFLLSSFAHNTFDDLDDDLDQVRESVYVYGINSFVGTDRGDIKEQIIEDIKDKLLIFEPRLKKNTIEISDVSDKNNNEIMLRIQGSLYTPVMDEDVDVTLAIDIETGHTKIQKTK